VFNLHQIEPYEEEKNVEIYIFFYSIGTNRHSIYALTIASLIVALALTKKENSALSTSRKPRFVSPG